MDLSPQQAEGAAIAFAAVALLVVGCTLAHAFARVVGDRASATRVQAGADAIVSALTGGAMAPAADALRRLRRQRRLGVLLPFASRVGGDNEASLSELARRTGIDDLAARWRRSRRSWRRLHGCRVAALLGGPPADVLRLLDDRRAEVRAAAADWAARVPTPDVIDALFVLLDDRAPGCSFAAKDALVRIGPPTVPRLIRELEGGGSVPHLLRCLHIATHLADPNTAPAALALVDHPEPGVRQGAVTVLGVTGASFAIDRLLLSALDTDASVRAATATSLGRLGAWTAVSALAELLRDRAWDVRRASVNALLDLGSPGHLVLQAARRGDDRFAADIAGVALGIAPASTPL